MSDRRDPSQEEEIKEEAVKVARELVEHARETARQMLLGTNLDTSKIPLICNKIVQIQTDLAWMKWITTALAGGVGLIALKILTKGL